MDYFGFSKYTVVSSTNNDNSVLHFQFLNILFLFLALLCLLDPPVQC